MAYISKELWDSRIRDLPCEQLGHIWCGSCFKAWRMFVSTKGICTFFFIMYSAQHILMRKKLSLDELKQVLRDYFQSVLHGYAWSLSFLAYNCTQRNLLGYFDYYMTVYGTAVCSGISFLLCPKSRIPVESTYFAIMSIECFIKHLASRNAIPRSKSSGTPYFMLCNSLLMYLLWSKQNTNRHLDITWIFKPYSRKDGFNSSQLCSHKGSCLSDLIKVSTKYFLIGLAISAVKLVLKIYKQSGSLGQIKLLNVSEPLFLLSYVAIHKAIHCLLTQWRGQDKGSHAAAAGLLSGLTYLIKPNIQLPASSTVLIVMALFEELKKKYNVPKLPYQRIFFFTSTMTLMSFAFIHNQIVPKFFMAMVRLGSNGRTNIIFENLEVFTSVKNR